MAELVDGTSLNLKKHLTSAKINECEQNDEVRRIIRGKADLEALASEEFDYSIPTYIDIATRDPAKVFSIC